MNYNPQPKILFQGNADRVKAHRALIDNPNLADSLQSALLQYQRELAEKVTPDLGSCAACHLKSQGAHEFIELFLNLAEQRELVTRPDTTNLASNVRSMPGKKN